MVLFLFFFFFVELNIATINPFTWKCLKKNFSAAVLIAKASNNNSTTNCSEEIAAAKEKLSDQIKFLASNLSIINDTLSQKSKALDEELVVHKVLFLVFPKSKNSFYLLLSI